MRSLIEVLHHHFFELMLEETPNHFQREDTQWYPALLHMAATNKSFRDAFNQLRTNPAFIKKIIKKLVDENAICLEPGVEPWAGYKNNVYECLDALLKLDFYGINGRALYYYRDQFGKVNAYRDHSVISPKQHQAKKYLSAGDHLIATGARKNNPVVPHWLHTLHYALPTQEFMNKMCALEAAAKAGNISSLYTILLHSKQIPFHNFNYNGYTKLYESLSAKKPDTSVILADDTEVITAQKFATLLIALAYRCQATLDFVKTLKSANILPSCSPIQMLEMILQHCVDTEDLIKKYAKLYPNCIEFQEEAATLHINANHSFQLDMMIGDLKRMYLTFGVVSPVELGSRLPEGRREKFYAHCEYLLAFCNAQDHSKDRTTVMDYQYELYSLFMTEDAEVNRFVQNCPPYELAGLVISFSNSEAVKQLFFSSEDFRKALLSLWPNVRRISYGSLWVQTKQFFTLVGLVYTNCSELSTLSSADTAFMFSCYPPETLFRMNSTFLTLLLNPKTIDSLRKLTREDADIIRTLQKGSHASGDYLMILKLLLANYITAQAFMALSENQQACMVVGPTYFAKWKKSDFEKLFNLNSQSQEKVIGFSDADYAFLAKNPVFLAQCQEPGKLKKLINYARSKVSDTDDLRVPSTERDANFCRIVAFLGVDKTEECEKVKLFNSTMLNYLLVLPEADLIQMLELCCERLDAFKALKRMLKTHCIHNGFVSSNETYELCAVPIKRLFNQVVDSNSQVADSNTMVTFWRPVKRQKLAQCDLHSPLPKEADYEAHRFEILSPSSATL